MESVDVREIVVDHGFVVKAQELQRHNGALWPVVRVERIQGIEQADNLFEGVAGDPRDGAWVMIDSQLKKVLVGLSSARREEYCKLFSLCDPTPQSLREIGFADFTIIEKAA